MKAPAASRSAGKLLVIGFAGGRIADISTNIPLIKGFSVVGVRAGEYARRFPERGVAIRAAVAELASNGALTPQIDRVLPLSRWREAFRGHGRAADRRESGAGAIEHFHLSEPDPLMLSLSKHASVSTAQ